MTFNLNDSPYGALYLLESTDIAEINGNFVEAITFTDDTYSAIATQITAINVPTANWQSIQCNTNLNEIYLLDAQDPEMSIYCSLNEYSLLFKVTID